MKRLLHATLAPAILAITAPALAGGPHEHGVSHLDVVLDGPMLAIDLRGAGHHLAGFEHAPETPQQRTAWQATRDGLADADALFPLPAQAGCTATRVEVTPPLATPAGRAGGTGSGHDHAHGGDWHATYRFECAHPDRLPAIEVGLFDRFPAHREVRYQRFSDTGQGGGTLLPGQTRLVLR